MMSVVTVNYKTLDYTLNMLESLFVHHVKGDIEVFVVENGSGDDMGEIRRRFPEVNVIESKDNLGFAGGCNLAIKKSKGDYVVLINPDIMFIDEALYAIRENMDENPEVGIGGASLKNFDGTQQASVWSFPTPIDQLLLLLKVNHLLPGLKPLRKWLMKDFSYGQSQDVDQVMGAFFCIRRNVFDKIGLFDEGFFMWYEEVDFCKRAKAAGFRIRYFTDVAAKHKKGSSFESIPTIKKQKMLRRSVRRYIRKHHGPAWGMLFIIGEPIFFFTSFVASIMKPV